MTCNYMKALKATLKNYSGSTTVLAEPTPIFNGFPLKNLVFHYSL